MADNTSSKRALVRCGVHSRALTFESPAEGIETDSSDEERLRAAIRVKFGDVLSETDEFFLQVKDEEWGEFVDIMPKQMLPARSVVHTVMKVNQQIQSKNNKTYIY